MESDDQQHATPPVADEANVEGAAAEPSAQPEQAANSSAPASPEPPNVAPGDTTIPPDLVPGYPAMPGAFPPQAAYPGAYPLPPTYPPTYPPPGYAAPPYPPYPGYPYPPAPYSYGPPPGPGYGYPIAPPPGAVATLPPWMPPVPAPAEPSAFAKPFPRAVTIGIGVGTVAVLALAYLLRVLALQGDWSSGALLVGILALLGTGIAVILATTRLAAGRSGARFLVLTVLLLALLGSTGVGALVMANPLHLTQAQSYESQKQWAAAIREYQLYGDEGSDITDIARVYDEWGEQYLDQHNFATAVNQFQLVERDYSDASSAVARAHRDLYKAYVDWLKASPDTVPYADAVTTLTLYNTDSACDAACRAYVATTAPQALYLYGLQLSAAKSYVLAITQFEVLLTEFAQSDYAPKAYAAAATAYYAEGQADLAQQSCPLALDAYHTLVSKYKDTPEAAKALTALAAPQDVHGIIANFPKNPIPTMHLSHSMNFDKFQFSNEYSTQPSSNGNFTFLKVKQGKYYITSSQVVSNGIYYESWYADSSKTSFYSITVGPLCPTTVNELSY